MNNDAQSASMTLMDVKGAFLEVVEEHRHRSFVLMLLFWALGAYAFWLMASTRQNPSGLMVFPIIGIAGFGLGFFAFQSVFYSRKICIDHQRVRIVNERFRKREEIELDPKDFKSLALRWVFPFRFWPTARLSMWLEHVNPLYTFEIGRFEKGASIEEFRLRAKLLGEQLGIQSFVDESLAADSA